MNNFTKLVLGFQAGENAEVVGVCPFEERELIKSFMVFGMKELKIILVLPHRSLLDYQLRNRRLAWWLSVYTRGGEGAWVRPAPQGTGERVED